MGPIFVENSKVPELLSSFGIIDIEAITLFPFVFCRGKIDSQIVYHENIHFQQYLETMVFGFIIIYLYDYLKGLRKYGDGVAAYFQVRAEQEAYEYDNDLDYLLARRKRWQWIWKYKI